MTFAQAQSEASGVCVCLGRGVADASWGSPQLLGMGAADRQLWGHYKAPRAETSQVLPLISSSSPLLHLPKPALWDPPQDEGLIPSSASGRERGREVGWMLLCKGCDSPTAKNKR